MDIPIPFGSFRKKLFMAYIMPISGLLFLKSTFRGMEKHAHIGSLLCFCFMHINRIRKWIINF
jgi:hypothetical protein